MNILIKNYHNTGSFYFHQGIIVLCYPNLQLNLNIINCIPSIWNAPWWSRFWLII